MDIHALLRRLRAGESERAVARALGIDRKTVGKYHAWAREQHLLDGPLPELAELHARLSASFKDDNPPQNHSPLEVYRGEIKRLVEAGKKPRTIYQLLSEHPGFAASESAVWRMVEKVRPPKTPEVVARLETAPGEVAQVDFGDVGQLIDPRTGQLRRAYVFTLVLGWSRHMYAELVFDQKIPTWLQCHQHAFEFLGGVPNRVVLDNLKAAIIQAYTRDKDVEVQRAYAECAEHYGFLIDPCWPATPQHKGKVERGGVGYIKQSFIPLLPPATTLPEANQRLREWLVNVAGVREHGTTHEAPLARFTTTERAALHPLPPGAYDPAIWKQVKLHRDGHVVFEKAYYSAPSRHVGQTLWLRAGLCEIRLFSNTFELITTHSRATQAGERQTQMDHLPPYKLSGLLASRERCQTQAATIGPTTAQVIAEMLAARPVDKLRSAGRVLKLAETYTPARLEAACQRGQVFGDTSHAALKHILEKGLDQLALPAPGMPADQVPLFARPAHELADAITRGATWN